MKNIKPKLKIVAGIIDPESKIMTITGSNEAIIEISNKNIEKQKENVAKKEINSNNVKEEKEEKETKTLEDIGEESII